MSPFIWTSKNFKYFGINLAKDVEVLYNKKCKILLRQLMQNLNKQRYVVCMDHMIQLLMYYFYTDS